MTEDPPAVEGERIRLRAVRDEDHLTRARFGRVAEIVRSLGGDLPEDVSMTVGEAALQLSWRFGEGPHWAIADTSDNSFVGVARLAPLDQNNRSANFAIAIFDPARLGKGLGTEATQLAIDYGFDSLGLLRIELTVFVENERAIAAYRKCGFETKERLTGTVERSGELLDDLVMELPRSRWEQLRG